MEKGNRQITAIELRTIAETFGFPIDSFLMNNYEPASGVAFVEEPEIESDIDTMRVSVPRLQRARLETVLLYLTGQCGAKPNMEINMLTYLLYFCDFNHYEIHEEQLTDLLYTRQSIGPSSAQLNGMIKEMVDENKILRIKSNCSGKPCIKYLPAVSANLMKISAAAKEVIDHVIYQFSDWPAQALCDFSAGDMPLRATKQGEPIEYELVFYRRPPYSVRVYEEDPALSKFEK